MFLVRSAINAKASNVDSLITKLLASKSPKNNKDILLVLADLQPNPQKSLEILKSLYDVHGSTDKLVQGRYLSMLVDSGNLVEATRLQQKLPRTYNEDEQELNEDEFIQKLIENGMPEKRKETKLRDVV